MIQGNGTTVVSSSKMQFRQFVTGEDYADYTTLRRIKSSDFTNTQSIDQKKMPWWYIGIPTAIVVMLLITITTSIIVYQRRRKFVLQET